MDVSFGENCYYRPQTKSLSRGGSGAGRGGYVRGGLCKGDPPYGKERLVRILLECFLVLRLFLSILTGLRNLTQLTWLNVSGNRLKVS